MILRNQFVINEPHGWVFPGVANDGKSGTAQDDITRRGPEERIADCEDECGDDEECLEECLRQVNNAAAGPDGRSIGHTSNSAHGADVLPIMTMNQLKKLDDGGRPTVNVTRYLGDDCLPLPRMNPTVNRGDGDCSCRDKAKPKARQTRNVRQDDDYLPLTSEAR